MKKILLSMALIAATTGAFAQNRLVKKAQGLVNQEKIDEAQAVLTEALNSGETKNMAMAWDLQGDIYQRIFAAELNKAAAHMPLDTMKFATNLYACVDAYEKCNSYDTEKEYVAKNKGNLMKFRTFYMYCGQFFFQNKQFDEAFKAYDGWLTFPETKKLVAGEPSVVNDTTFDKSQVAYYACLAAYQAKNYPNVEKHINEALNYTKEIKTVRQLRLMTYIEQGDTAKWVEASKEFALDDEAIAQNLLAYYQEKNDNEASMKFADGLLAKNPENKIANYSKGVLLFGQQKFVEALPYFEKCVQIDPEFTDAYYNAGVCCCNEGYNVNESISSKKMKPADNKKAIEQVKDWYRKAEPYFLKVKEMDPENPDRWASRLKTIYYIIGDKAKEQEMDAYLK